MVTLHVCDLSPSKYKYYLSNRRLSQLELTWSLRFEIVYMDCQQSLADVHNFYFFFSLYLFTNWGFASSTKITDTEMI